MSTVVPAQRSKPDSSPPTDSTSDLDIKPFRLDMLILERLDAWRLSAFWVMLITGVIIGGSVLWSASDSNMLWWPDSHARSLWHDLWLFLTREPVSHQPQAVSLLRDYPSMVLVVTVVTAVGLVYHLFRGATTLHSTMERTRCIKFDDQPGGIAKAELAEHVATMNRLFEKWRAINPLIFTLILIGMVLVNLNLSSGLFSFLGSDVYHHWWASLDPIRPGGVVWVVFGTVGIYMVFVQGILGISYTAFLRKLKRAQQSRNYDMPSRTHHGYPFRANMLNPDGFYGWQQLRGLITNLQIGAVCTLLSAWAFSYFLLAATGPEAMIIVLSGFIGVVGYVYFSVTSNFKRQATRDRHDQTMAVIEEMEPREKRLLDDGSQDQMSRLEDSMYLLLAYKRLDYISKIPTTPLRRSWLIAGLLSLLGTLSAIVIPIVQYMTSYR